MLKVSAFYLEKQRSFIQKKKRFFKLFKQTKTLFTDPIFSEGFDFGDVNVVLLGIAIKKIF